MNNVYDTSINRINENISIRKREKKKISNFREKNATEKKLNAHIRHGVFRKPSIGKFCSGKNRH